MHLPIYAWANTIQRLGYKRVRRQRRESDRTITSPSRRLRLEPLEERRLLAADLALSAFYADGNQLILDYDVLNETAGAFTVGIYRSGDGGATLDALIATQLVDDAGDLSIGSHQVALWADFTDVQEDYKLIAVLDSENTVSESNETNNDGLFSGGVFQAVDGTVHVHGTGAADVVNVNQPGKIEVIFNGTTYQYTASTVSEVHLRAHGGNDELIGSSDLNVAVWLFGGEGDDTLLGGMKDDYIEGNDGNDTIDGREGIDTVDGVVETNTTVPTRGIADLVANEEDITPPFIDQLTVIDDSDNADNEPSSEITTNANPLLFGSIVVTTGGLSLTDATDTDAPTSDTNMAVVFNQVNYAPTTSGIADINVDQDAANTVIDLFASFADIEDGDTNLTYTIESNSNAALFTSTTIDAQTGALTLIYAPHANGSADITIRATDSEGATVDVTFAVHVAAVNDAPTTSGFSNVNVDKVAADTVIDLLAAFDDVDNTDNELPFEVISNSNPLLFTSVVVTVSGLVFIDANKKSRDRQTSSSVRSIPTA